VLVRGFWNDVPVHADDQVGDGVSAELATSVRDAGGGRLVKSASEKAIAASNSSLPHGHPAARGSASSQNSSLSAAVLLLLGARDLS
jgi:hypothetical protein